MDHEATCNCAEECMTDCYPQRAHLTGDSASHIYRILSSQWEFICPRVATTQNVSLALFRTGEHRQTDASLEMCAGSRQLKMAGLIQCVVNATWKMTLRLAFVLFINRDIIKAPQSWDQELGFMMKRWGTCSLRLIKQQNTSHLSVFRKI